MVGIPFPEIDPNELEAAGEIHKHLRAAATHEKDLYPQEAAEGSDFARDEKLSSEAPTDANAQHLLSTGYGALMGLGAWLGSDNGKNEVSMTVPLHGGYALLRNAVECGGWALWLMEPDSPRGRVRRLLQFEWDEAEKAECFAVESGEWQVQKSVERRKRLDAYAQRAGITKWNPPRPKSEKSKQRQNGQKDRLPSTTKMLGDLAPYRSMGKENELSWLAAWQLSSGFAHGKVWAAHSQNQMIQQVTLPPAPQRVVQMRTNLQNLLRVLIAASTVLDTALERYMDLSVPSAE